MVSMNDIFLKENMNLDEYLILTREKGDVLAIKTKYIGIKQRQDRMMSINFNVSPPQMKEIEGFFEGTNDFDTLYYDISQTGFVRTIQTPHGTIQTPTCREIGRASCRERV